MRRLVVVIALASCGDKHPPPSPQKTDEPARVEHTKAPKRHASHEHPHGPHPHPRHEHHHHLHPHPHLDGEGGHHHPY